MQIRPSQRHVPDKVASVRVRPLRRVDVIPSALNLDLCPRAGADRGYDFGLRHKGFPGIAAGVDNFVVGFPDTVAQEVAAQIIPNIFHGVEFWRIGRQGHHTMLSGTTTFGEPCHPAPSRISRAVALTLTDWLISAKCLFMASMPTSGMTTATPVPRAGQMAPNKYAHVNRRSR